MEWKQESEILLFFLSKFSYDHEFDNKTSVN